MSPAMILNIQLGLGYVPWLLCFAAYIWPRVRSMEPVDAQRAIATLHSFRFFGLVFLVPGVVGPDLAPGFASFAAYGDFATGLLAMLALLAVKRPAIFWPLVVAFNVVGVVDLLATTTTASCSTFPAMPASWARPTQSRSSTCRC